MLTFKCPELIAAVQACVLGFRFLKLGFRDGLEHDSVAFVFFLAQSATVQGYEYSKTMSSLSKLYLQACRRRPDSFLVLLASWSANMISLGEILGHCKRQCDFGSTSTIAFCRPDLEGHFFVVVIVWKAGLRRYEYSLGKDITKVRNFLIKRRTHFWTNGSVYTIGEIMRRERIKRFVRSCLTSSIRRS